MTATAQQIHGQQTIGRRPSVWSVATLLTLLGFVLTSGAGHAQSSEAAAAIADATEPTAETPEAAEEATETETSAPEPVDVQRRPDEDVEVIHVRARRGSLARAEALSVTAFDQASLDELGIQDIDSLQQFVPSLHIGQVGTSAVITLRGIGFDNLTVLGEPGVIFEIDGVPLSRPSAANSAFYDVENVEVLRGPQGTQGGRNSTAGRIAISSARPTADLEVFGDTQIGESNQIIQRAVLNVPIWGEYMMSRMSLNYQKHDGYQRNILPIYNDSKFWADDADEISFRGQLMTLITDNLQVRAFGTYSHQRGVGPAYKTIGPLFRQALYCPDSGTYWSRPFCPLSTLGGLSTVVNPDDPRLTSANVVGLRNDYQYGFTGHLNYDFPEIDGIGNISLGTVMSYQFNHTQNGDGKNFFCFANPNKPCAVANYGVDLDATNSYISFVDTDQTANQNSYEVWLESRDAKNFSWKVGMFHLNETIYGDSLVGVVQTPETIAASFSSGESQQTAVTDTKAGYGEFEFWLLDNVQIKGGIRYTRGAKSIKRQALAGGRKDLRTMTWSAWTPMALVRWDVTDDNSLAVSATRGFKLGGFSIPRLNLGNNEEGQPNEQAPVEPYDAESVWSYEFLSKNQFNDGETTLNLSLFWVNYNSYQACLVAAEGFQCDVGDAQTRGVELEGQWQATPGLRLDAIFNFLDSKVENLRLLDPTERIVTEQGAPNPLFYEKIDVSGNQLTKAPKFSLTLGGQYEFDLANYGLFGYLTPRFQYRFQTRTYYRVFNLEKFSQKPFNTIDFKVTWRSEDDRLSLEGFVSNITDTDTINSIIVGTIATGSPVIAQYLPPRVWGLRVGYRF